MPKAISDTLIAVNKGIACFAPGRLYRCTVNLTGWIPRQSSSGSWLNMVEIEIGVLRGQCLDRRIASQEQLVSEIAAWERQRNASRARIKWMFTTEKARDKMGRTYPLCSGTS